MSYIGENYDSWELANLMQKELVGHRIVAMTEEIIKLDNGVTFNIQLNEGCGGCSSGWSELDVVNFDKKYSEAAVMNVVYESYYTDKEKNKNYGQDEFKIFIYLVNKEVIEIDGDEGVGNGCYGSGFWVSVTR